MIFNLHNTMCVYLCVYVCVCVCVCVCEGLTDYLFGREICHSAGEAMVKTHTDLSWGSVVEVMNERRVNEKCVCAAGYDWAISQEVFNMPS